MTKTPDWSYAGVLVARSVEEALAIGAGLDDVVMVGGGGFVYADAMALATDQILTEVHATPDGDTHYPDFDEAEWQQTRLEEHLENDPPYEVRWLERRS